MKGRHCTEGKRGCGNRGKAVKVMQQPSAGAGEVEVMIQPVGTVRQRKSLVFIWGKVFPFVSLVIWLLIQFSIVVIMPATGALLQSRNVWLMSEKQ